MDRRGTSSRRARRDSGASAVEYGLIIAGAGVVLVALSFATGKAVSGAFLTNATAVGGTPGVVGAADLGGVVAPTSGAPTTTSAAPTTSSAAPTTTSAAPTTSSAAPTTTSAAPTTTSAAPTSTSATPTVSLVAVSWAKSAFIGTNYSSTYTLSRCTYTYVPASAASTVTMQEFILTSPQDGVRFNASGLAPAGTTVTVSGCRGSTSNRQNGDPRNWTLPDATYTIN